MIRVAPFALILLAACSPSKTDQATLAAVEAQQRRDVAEDGRIACAKAGTPALQRDCTVERTDGPDGLILTIRHPDGAFRRLLVTKDGRGVVAADGAEPARVAVLGPGRIEVTIAGDRYDLPATVKGGGAKR